jgi:YfiR/HmsC-like
VEILSVLPLVMLGALAQQTTPTLPPGRPTLEYQVKAAYILNFVNFTEWPADALGPVTDPFRICLAGADPFGGALESTVKGEAVLGHPIAIERVTRAEGALQCQVLFVPAGSAAPTAEWLRPLASLPILVIGESNALFSEGGVVSFAVEQGHVRFDVDRQNAQRHGVQLSSRVLRLARSVR